MKQLTRKILALLLCAVLLLGMTACTQTPNEPTEKENEQTPTVSEDQNSENTPAASENESKPAEGNDTISFPLETPETFSMFAIVNGDVALPDCLAWQEVEAQTNVKWDIQSALGVEIEENSELDLFEAFKKHDNDPRIPAKVAEMEAELGEGNKKPEVLPKLAQYELTLLDWVEAHRGYRKYVAIAGKCWPAFQTQFGFVPCYVNSRLTGMGIPVSCEVDIYGCLSEFIGTCVSEDAVTLLDINNSVPADMYKESIEGKFDYTQKDTFMGFHCGNTCSKKLSSCTMKYQKIMARNLPEEVTQGTLEGDIVPGDITFYRLQSTADCKLRAYMAEGEVLPVATKSFGGIGVFAIPEMGRFYRHVLIEKNYPHHGAVAFGHFGKALYEVFKYIGVPLEDINYNQPKGVRYPTENPFA